MDNNKFQLLREKKLLAVLDGDKDFGNLIINGLESDIKISMPYLSGPKLCDISRNFGLPVSYGWGTCVPSRWSYLDNLLVHCIKNKRESDLLSFLFSKNQFHEKLEKLTPKDAEDAYLHIIRTVIDYINGVLNFGGNEFIQIGSQFIVREMKCTVTLDVPSIIKIDRSYVVDLYNRAMRNIIDCNYDSVITQSRTLLEEVFFYVIEKKGEKPSDSGDIKKLYNQVKQLYNMHHNKDMDKRINELLSGLEKILSSIAEMRNKASDSHGVGANRINIGEHHARLFLNSAIIMADFILAVSEKSTD